MSKINYLPQLRTIDRTGHIIYSPDGIHSYKITIQQLYNIVQSYLTKLQDDYDDLTDAENDKTSEIRSYSPQHYWATEYDIDAQISKLFSNYPNKNWKTGELIYDIYGEVDDIATAFCHYNQDPFHYRKTDEKIRTGYYISDMGREIYDPLIDTRDNVNYERINYYYDNIYRDKYLTPEIESEYGSHIILDHEEYKRMLMICDHLFDKGSVINGDLMFPQKMTFMDAFPWIFDHSFSGELIDGLAPSLTEEQIEEATAAINTWLFDNKEALERLQLIKDFPIWAGLYLELGGCSLLPVVRYNYINNPTPEEISIAYAHGWDITDNTPSSISYWYSSIDNIGGTTIYATHDNPWISLDHETYRTSGFPNYSTVAVKFKYYYPPFLSHTRVWHDFLDLTYIDDETIKIPRCFVDPIFETIENITYYTGGTVTMPPCCWFDIFDDNYTAEQFLQIIDLGLRGYIFKRFEQKTSKKNYYSEYISNSSNSKANFESPLMFDYTGWGTAHASDYGYCTKRLSPAANSDVNFEPDPINQNMSNIVVSPESNAVYTNEYVIINGPAALENETRFPLLGLFEKYLAFYLHDGYYNPPSITYGEYSSKYENYIMRYCLGDTGDPYVDSFKINGNEISERDLQDEGAKRVVLQVSNGLAMVHERYIESGEVKYRWVLKVTDAIMETYPALTIENGYFDANTGELIADGIVQDIRVNDISVVDPVTKIANIDLENAERITDLQMQGSYYDYGVLGLDYFYPDTIKDDQGNYHKYHGYSTNLTYYGLTGNSYDSDGITDQSVSTYYGCEYGPFYAGSAYFYTYQTMILTFKVTIYSPVDAVFTLYLKPGTESNPYRPWDPNDPDYDQTYVDFDTAYVLADVPTTLEVIKVVNATDTRQSYNSAYYEAYIMHNIHQETFDEYSEYWDHDVLGYRCATKVQLIDCDNSQQ